MSDIIKDPILVSAILDFYPHEFFSALLGHETAKEGVRREMESAEYRLRAGCDVVGRQHVPVFFRKKP